MRELLSSEGLIAAAFVVGGFVVGWVLERAVLRRLQRVALQTSFVADDVIVPAFRGLVLFWCVALGLYLATDITAESSALRHWWRVGLVVALVGSFTVLAARITAGFLRIWAAREESVLPRTSLVPNLAQVFVYVVGLLIVLDSLDISVAPILTALGVGGLAIALALQDTLSNLFAGIYLLASRQIRTGDFVRLDTDEEGFVVDVAWRATALRTLYDNTIIVPNSKLASAIVTNYAFPHGAHLFPITLGAAYESDLERVEAVVRSVADEVARVRRGTAAQLPASLRPEFRYHTFGEFSINFSVMLPVSDYRDGLEARSAFIKALVARFRQEQLPLPFPIHEFQMEVGMRGETLIERERYTDPGARED